MAATSIITERSPYIVRTSFSVPQTTVPLADWAAANGIKTVVTVSGGATYPGLMTWRPHSSGAFSRPPAGKRSNPCACRCPATISRRRCSALRMQNRTPLDRLCPGRQAEFLLLRVSFFSVLDKSGIKFIAEGSLTEDDIVNQIGDAALVLSRRSITRLLTTVLRTRALWRLSRKPMAECGQT